MPLKKISIITTTFNCKDKIEDTIISVLNQNSKIYEYIIMDSCSQDGTQDILEKYKDNINIYVEKDSGIYDAMNKGIIKAKGQYLYFLGAGDKLEKNILKTIEKEITEINSPDLIYGKVFNIENNEEYGFEYEKYNFLNRNICHQAIFYKKDIFNRIGVYNLDYKYLADYDLNMRIFSNKYNTNKYLNQVFAYYEGNGVSDNNVDTKFKKDKPKLIFKYYGIITFLIYSIMRKVFTNKYKK
ncbi:glycosyltransferase family 2 protein [Clostridium intestinale]|uniref:Glycosyltransferase n=1 Tax=Clostridium intestinale TaxID=36845 RepID=A0A7D6VQ58_9CLOT|nr:glycosyltransferase family 2 protein [Clostridium intestinale]QLY79129.1 glycosyltransferase [Clostridium intestinale]